MELVSEVGQILRSSTPAWLVDDVAAVGSVEPNRPLAPLTRYHLGGPADWFARPSSVAQLATLVARCRQEQWPCRILGGGANLLVDDDGIDGVVVRLDEPSFSAIEWDVQCKGQSRDARSSTVVCSPGNVLVRAGAGASLERFVHESVKRGLSGLECMAGIPGSVGGGIRMNAGGRWGEIGGAVREVAVVESGSGGLKRLMPEQVGFEYRRTALGDAIVCEVLFELTPADPEEVRRRYREILETKLAAQPPMSARSAGCVFKNPPGDSAGRLIDAAGLKERRIGSAIVSPIHANFIVSDVGGNVGVSGDINKDGGAGQSGRASDVLELISLVRETVAQRFAVNLDLEIEVWRRAS